MHRFSAGKLLNKNKTKQKNHKPVRTNLGGQRDLIPELPICPVFNKKITKNARKQGNMSHT